ncbi:hypothetical protein HDU83_004963 [Entophlyctis luteolus]|nr:hypothetical protein HDU83_004963 [Entophlyctis luteolus]KAJ3378413.1 hypothetical protein HDU84_007577 [Entophlyctis sp. JEL0112]
MRVSAFAVGSIAAAAAAHADPGRRDLQLAGGWSLSVDTACPSDTTACPALAFAGVECCPSASGTLSCATHVNTGQPYACCPSSNQDCRGDVENRSNYTLACADSSWALWQIASSGNMFCCLSGYTGYFNSSQGQDAVGQCQSSSMLASGLKPAVQLYAGSDAGESTMSAADMAETSGTSLLTAAATAATTATNTIAASAQVTTTTKTGGATVGARICAILSGVLFVML